VFRVAVFLVVIATLSGCGRGQSDRSQVTSATRGYLNAVASGDGSGACSLLSDTGKLGLRRIVKSVEPNTYKPTTLSCTQQIVGAHAIYGSRLLAQLRDAKLGVPRVSGDTATKSFWRHRDG
jgi:hypothetical protein